MQGVEKGEFGQFFGEVGLWDMNCAVTGEGCGAEEGTFSEMRATWAWLYNGGG